MISMSIDSNFNEMLSVISHEMKNPISLIKANLELLRLSATDFSVYKNLEMISRELDELEQISYNLIQTLKCENDIEKVFLVDMAEDILEPYENTHTDIEFSIETNNEEIYLYGSNFQISLILKNLVKNAVEAIHQRGYGGFVKINLIDEGSRVIIEVIDNGIGLQSSDKDKIYEKFYTTKSTGTGLGLSIIKYILSTKDGHVTLDNNFYGGCTASVVFQTEN